MSVTMSRKRPKVTICVPVYNGEQYLKAALDSILKQTYRDFELYILDNASTDKTPQIIRKYRDPRVRHIRHKKNIGGYPNWDYGIREAKGEYIAVYHADDIYEPRILEKQLAIFRKHRDVSCVFTNATLIDGAGRRIGEWTAPPELIRRPVAFTEVFTYAIRMFRSPFLSPSCIATRAAYRNAGRYAARFKESGDVDMYLRLVATGPAYFLDEPLVRYRHTGTQWSIRYSTTYEGQHELFRVLDEHLTRSKQDIPPSIIRAYERHRDWDFTVRAINLLAKERPTGEDRRTARQHLQRSLTIRRVLGAWREPLLLATTAILLFAAHLGLGTAVAKRIHAYRIGQHLSA